jgi:methylated-DNA-[protein]-cysteine S-methyltransferase
MKQLYSDIFDSPVGNILVIADADQLCYLDFEDNDERLDRLLSRRFGEYEITPKANVLNMQTRLEKYFNGDWEAFDGLNISTDGTSFQQQVWKSLRSIPAGDAISYDQLAGAINRNPVAIIIPCHRVIGKDGSLRGYAGGVDRKAWLLNHEGFRI